VNDFSADCCSSPMVIPFRMRPAANSFSLWSFRNSRCSLRGVYPQCPVSRQEYRAKQRMCRRLYGDITAFDPAKGILVNDVPGGSDVLSALERSTARTMKQLVAALRVKLVRLQNIEGMLVIGGRAILYYVFNFALRVLSSSLLYNSTKNCGVRLRGRPVHRR
jgi:hypothetical protein